MHKCLTICNVLKNRTGILNKVVVCFAFLSIIPIYAQTITLEGDVWAPYVMDPATGNSGYMIEIIEIIFERAGYTVDFKIVPWSRTLLDVENGIADAAVGIYYIQAREHKFILPEEELGISINRLYTLKSKKWNFSGHSSMDTMVLGIIADYDYGELNDYIVHLKLIKSPNLSIISGNGALQNNLRKLQSGRIDVIVEDYLVMDYFVNKLGMDNSIREAGTLQPTNKVGIAFTSNNPKSTVYAKIVTEGIRKLRASGELKTILDKYAIKDWK